MTQHGDKRILVVEDDVNLGFLLVDFLEMEGFKVKLCRDGETGEKLFLSNHFDLCILDCILPEMDGFTLAKRIRERNKEIPFIFLTAKSLKEDKIKGFKSGADDYITKPFEVEELVYRMRAILNRAKVAGENIQTVFNIGSFQFDLKNQALSRRNLSIRLTARESEILNLLCLHKNEILKKQDILQALWGQNDYFTSRSLDVFIAKLRKYLKDDPHVSIENVHSVGFILHTV